MAITARAVADGFSIDRLRLFFARQPHVGLLTFAALLTVSVVVVSLSAPVVKRYIWNTLYSINYAASQREAERTAFQLSAELRAGVPASAVLQRFQAMLESTSQNQAYFVCLVSNDRHVVAHPRRSHIGSDVDGWFIVSVDGKQSYSQSAIDQVPVGGVLHRTTGSLAGTRDLVFQAPVSGAPWNVTVHVDTALINADTQRIFHRVALGLGGLVLLLAVIGSWVVRRMAERHQQQLDTNHDALHQAMDELRRAQKQLIDRERFASVGQAVMGMANELDTPIKAGLSAASRLTQFSEQYAVAVASGDHLLIDQHQFARATEQEARAVLTQLTAAQNLLNSCTQVLQDQTANEKRVINMRNYLNTVVSSMQGDIRKRLLKVKVHCASDVTLLTCPGSWYQIISKLIIHSVNHAYPSGCRGCIQIFCQLDGDELELRYEDDGEGMTASQRDNIFLPFYQQPQAQTGDSDASGLGMHMVFHLVRNALGGHVVCHSEPGQGTSFTIRVPLLDEETLNCGA